LEESRSTVDEVAAQCGFGTRESMRRSFQRTLRVSPTACRSRFANEDCSDPHQQRFDAAAERFLELAR
jgi:transcriptional regulator GlxA family with amidase domain